MVSRFLENHLKDKKAVWVNKELTDGITGYHEWKRKLMYSQRFKWESSCSPLHKKGAPNCLADAKNLPHGVLGGCGKWQRTWAMNEGEVELSESDKGTFPSSCEKFNWNHLNCSDLFCALFNQVESRALYMVVVRPLDVVQGCGM